jgi:hypothetical protein
MPLSWQQEMPPYLRVGSVCRNWKHTMTQTNWRAEEFQLLWHWDGTVWELLSYDHLGQLPYFQAYKAKALAPRKAQDGMWAWPGPFGEAGQCVNVCGVHVVWGDYMWGNVTGIMYDTHIWQVVYECGWLCISFAYVWIHAWLYVWYEQEWVYVLLCVEYGCKNVCMMVMCAYAHMWPHIWV